MSRTRCFPEAVQNCDEISNFVLLKTREHALPIRSLILRSCTFSLVRSIPAYTCQKITPFF